MTRYRYHHLKAAIERITLPRIKGGRGVVNIANQHKAQIANLRAYFYQKSTTSELHRVVAEADNNATPLNMSERNVDLSTAPVTNKSQRGAKNHSTDAIQTKPAHNQQVSYK
jgi:hypothetical protein